MNADDDELEDAVDEEVERVMDEITAGMPVAHNSKLPTKEQEQETEVDDLESRLGALKN